MIISMTGYGKSEIHLDNISFSLEIKSVNSRFLEIVTRLPQQIQYLENDIKKEIKNSISRGRIDVSLKISSVETEYRIELNNEKTDLFYKMLTDLKTHLNLTDNITLKDILECNKFDSIFKRTSEDTENLLNRDRVFELVSKAVAELLAMKNEEGMSAEKDIRLRIENIEFELNEIKKKSVFSVADNLAKLKERLSVLVDKANIDDNRLLQEIAILVDRSDISEEIARLESHISQFYNITNEASSGKKLEFLTQEINREANTIGSKTNNSDVAHHVVNLKSELEKIREMLQNIE